MTYAGKFDILIKFPGYNYTSPLQLVHCKANSRYNFYIIIIVIIIIIIIIMRHRMFITAFVYSECFVLQPNISF